MKLIKILIKVSEESEEIKNKNNMEFNAIYYISIVLSISYP